MGFCQGPCCNAAERERIRALRQAEFEAYCDARDRTPVETLPVVEVADAPEANDRTYAEALAFMDRPFEVTKGS